MRLNVAWAGILIALATLIAFPPGRAISAGWQHERGPPNFQTDPEFARIDRERGAVLCAWLILIEIRAIHQQCHVGEQPELLAAFDRSLDRFNTFIVANSNETRASIEAQTARQSTLSRAQAAQCEGDGEEFYQYLTAQGAAGIDAWTETTLAVARPPVLNPCL